MACLSVTTEGIAAAAGAFDNTVARILTQLDRIRNLMTGLEADRLGVPAEQLQALLISYDIYVQMLTDALTDLAADVRRRHAPANETQPAQVGDQPSYEEAA